MDLTMPHMDGIECISNLTTFNPRVKILVVSALSNEATGIEALDKRATGFLLIPISFGRKRVTSSYGLHWYYRNICPAQRIRLLHPTRHLLKHLVMRLGESDTCEGNLIDMVGEVANTLFWERTT